MAKPKTKYFRCQNRSKCELAKYRQTIEISEGTRFNCPLSDPNCERTNLREIDPKPPVPRAVIGGLALAVVVIGLVIFLWPKDNSESKRGSVEAALQEVWPWLK